RTHGTAPPALDPRRWAALVVILVAGVMDLLDVTIVNVAAPSILRDLQATYAQFEWVVSGYVLGFAALLITGGRLGGSFGRKGVFLIGGAGFTVASALCGLAVNPAMLIGARFFEGAMAGLMVPQILAIIHVTFPLQERGKVFGIWGGVLGSASVAGVVLGGVLVPWNLAGRLAVAPDLFGEHPGRGRGAGRGVVRGSGVPVAGRAPARPARHGAGHHGRADAGLPADRGPFPGLACLDLRPHGGLGRGPGG